jgi:hypothetical protein
MAHLNVRDILSKDKKDDLTVVLDSYKFDVLVITETWLYPKISDKEIEIPGYQIFRKDRTFSTYQQRGGGICIYVNQKWNVTVCQGFNTQAPSESLKIVISR